MSDLISRQAAIDAVSRGCHELRGIFAECEKNLNTLPSVQPERKTGRWIKVNVPAYDGGFLTEWECDQCHEHQIVPQKFCGECGCKMEVEHED